MGPHKPSILDLMLLPRPLFCKPSPDGSKIAFICSTSNFKDNFHQNYCYLYFFKNPKIVQLTQSGSVTQIEWLDNESIVLLKSNPAGTKDEKKKQVYLYKNLIGEPIQITDDKFSVEQFKIFASGIIYLSKNQIKEEKEEREELFGDFTYVEKEESTSNLYYLHFNILLEYNNQMKISVKKEAEKQVKPILDLSPYLKINRAITSFILSKSKDAIYINTRLRDDLYFLEETCSYQLLIDVDLSLEKYIKDESLKFHKNRSTKKESEEEEQKTFGKFTFSKLNLPKGAEIIDISPDSSKLLIRYKIQDNKFYIQSDISILNVKKLHESPEIIEKELREHHLTKNFDRDPIKASWGKNGIYVSYFDYSKGKIARISELGNVSELHFDKYDPYDFELTDKDEICILAANERTPFEFIFASPNNDSYDVIKISDFQLNIKDWDLGSIESVRWKSKDGLEIEGVLRKPSNFDPKKKYPLVFVVHGGPTWLSHAVLYWNMDLLYYPSIQFVNKEILVLKPNYRGSIGRGQAFSEIYKDNIGFADLADIESGLDYLIEQGFVDETKIGCMGWSQGGYISAFVSTHSKRFKAVSIGAGISSWYTYYIANDIRQWTLHYLNGSPYENTEYYKTTAPINKIREAKTPALIQHGENDQRVPLSNATELYRGFVEMGVPTELFVFKGMPHGITKPRENRAIMHQNLTWFSHWLLGEDLDFFSMES